MKSLETVEGKLIGYKQINLSLLPVNISLH